MSVGISREVAKHWWLQCVACSEASMTTQMRGFGIAEPAYEQAIHPFSGGFMHLGHACGLLTGAVMTAGFIARSRFNDDEARSGAALHVAIQLAKAHEQLAGSVNCREITGTSLTSLSGRLRYVRQGKARDCGRLHLKWAPQAQQVIDNVMAEFSERGQQVGSCANCSVQTMRELSAPLRIKEEDAVLVAGFAGGVGLHGNVCGALAAGVFAMSVASRLSHKQRKRDSRIRGSFEELAGTTYRGASSMLRLELVRQLGSDQCVDIVGRKFTDAADHYAFVAQGGCVNVRKIIVGHVAGCATTEPFNS